MNKLQDLAAYPLLRLDPLLTDVEEPSSCVECVLCDDSESISGDPEKLYWFEYHPSVHASGSNKICDHCLFPPPKNIDFVMCAKEKHLYCLYCIELKLFRIQLGRFVMEQEDDNNADLGMQWERDYVAYRHSSTKHWSRSRGRSVADQMNGGICNCFNKKKDDYFSEEKENRTGTTRLAGYKSAQINSSIIEMEVRDDKKNKDKKKKKKKKKKHDDDDDSKEEDDENNGGMDPNHVVDEADIDEIYEENFEVAMDETIVIETKKKLKAVKLLLEACKTGNRQPPSVIIELNYDKYAVYCFAYVMSKLELKQRKFLFHTLEFMAMVSPTTVMIQLIMQYKKPLLMLPYKRIDSVLLSVIRGSKYSIATALKMAALAGEFASIDLSAKETFLKIKEKYESIAVELLKQIESHHLAAVLLETPSDIEGLTPLELAFEHKLFSFLSQSKIEKIAHQVWIEQFFLNPTRTFEVSDIDSWNVLEFLKNPYKFYFQPFGKYLIQTFLFFAYLFMFSYILIERPSIYDVPEMIEVIFWVFNIGYFGFELYQALIEDGLQDYLTDWTNYIDMSISVNFAAQIVIRLVWIFGTNNLCDNNKLFRVEYNYNDGLPLQDYQRCPTSAQISSLSGYWGPGKKCNQTFSDWTLPNNNTETLCDFEPTNAFYMSNFDKCNCWKQLDYYLTDSCCRKADSTEAVLFNFLYGANAILLWIRTLYFAEQDSTLGPLIKIIMAMKDDFINYLKLTLLFMLGFSFAIRAFIGNYSYEFDKVQSTILYMFKSTFGKIDFSVLEACGDSPSDLCKDKGWVPEWRSNLVQLLIMMYLVIALLMIRLLIAMISFTYNKMIRQAEHQVVYQYIKNAYELDKSSGLMPPPLNIFVFGITIVWLIMDVLMVVLINRYIDVENHLQLAKPIGSSYITRVWHGIQDLFSRNTSYWICAHCKEHNHELYDVASYLSQFKPACDPQDAKIVEVYAPQICQRCYRNKSEVGRMTIVLQQISFLVFCVIVYPCLIVCVLIPALFSWIDYALTDQDSENGQWDRDTDDDDEDKKKQQLKRHQTMGGAVQKKKDRKSPEYKLRKKREKELKKKKEMIKQAERYRMYRQMQQLDTQLDAVPSTDSTLNHLNHLKKQLKQIIKHYNPTKKRHILTPNINEIVDEVTSDKTPIAKLQKQVVELHSLINEILGIVKASSQFTLATTLAQQSFNDDNDDNDDDDDDKKDDPSYNPSSLTSINSRRNNNENGDNFMISVSKAAQNIKTALSNKPSNKPYLPSTQISNRISSSKSNKHNKRQSIKDIVTSALGFDNDNNNNVNIEVSGLTNKQSLKLKPTDVMRHKSSYKRKSRNNLLIMENYASSDDDENDQKQEEIQQGGDTKNKIKLKNNLSEITEKYLESLLEDHENDINNNDQ